MMNFTFNLEKGKNLRVLCLGAHSDDIEIGCGGTILRLIREYPDCRIHWVVFSALGPRKAEAEHGAASFAGPRNLDAVGLNEFQDGFMPYQGAEIKAVFEGLKKHPAPDLIFTHTRKDAHQDHRTLCELTWNTFRNHFILEYEIPKYDGDLGQPNAYVPLTEEDCASKVHHLIETFQTQRSKRWFEESTFLSLMRLRGMESNAASGYAEAFYCRKLLL